MQDWYPPIVKAVIVVVLGLLFIAVVFVPQKDMQNKLGDYQNQTQSSISASLDDSAPTMVVGSNVITTVSQYCKVGNTVIIYVTNGTTYTYTTSTTSGVTPITTLVSNPTAYYSKKVTKDSVTGAVLSMTFQIQP